MMARLAGSGLPPNVLANIMGMAGADPMPPAAPAADPTDYFKPEFARDCESGALIQ